MWVTQFFCKHNWEQVGDIKLYRRGIDLPTGFERIYICKKCLKKNTIRY